MKRLPPEIKNRIRQRIEWLAENLDLIRPLPLKGKFKSFYKFRVGDYRIIYEIDRENFLIIVHLVGHRRDIYR
ncbi:hypothetical protein TH606_05215 [Thermodesulfatator autotrophicus]|uniref:Addiction module antitoxin n=1 Tax=Thermodesulfatator autotrophicus TaxID=1795632 RepID=A0A177E747_9BACT|nr:hypothetical protein TH606_05215 [Thermodesulfatator autotrophicus]